MLLDFNPDQGLYFLTLDAGDALTVGEMQNEHGWDYSETGSRRIGKPILFTAEPYAAAAFGECGTPAARSNLRWIMDAVERSRAPNSDRHITTPGDTPDLWPFQRASIDYALSTTNCLVADEPGLGKTPIGICVANELRAKRVLCIVPAVIRRQWARKILEWTTMPQRRTREVELYPRSFVHVIERAGLGQNPEAPWTVVSWDLLRNEGIYEGLMLQNFDLIIMDEIHYAKSHEAQRTRRALGTYGPNPRSLLSRAPRALGLSGTPMPNRPREIYSVARAFDWQSIGFLSEEAFQERYNPSERIEGVRKDGTTYVYSDERSGRHAELQNRLRANFMSRHLKNDVWPDRKLPVFDLIRVEETRVVKAALEYERMLDIDPESLEGSDISILGHVAEARRMMGEAIAPQAAAYIEELIRGGEEKLVVFGWHISVLDILQTKLHHLGIVRVDGATSAAAKDVRVAQFCADPKCRIILGNVLSLGTGTDGLQHVASHALIVEGSWVPGENIQCFDRLDRGGQSRQVQGDIFVAPRSILEKVLASALRKLQTTNSVLDRRMS